MAESKLSIINKIFSIGAIKCDENVELTDLKKSDAEAEKIRREGNSYFREGHLEKAIESYTKSLSFARSDELKGKAFGNRSACFFGLYKRDQCLKDIELAKKHGYSTKTLRSRRLEALRRPKVPLTGDNSRWKKADEQLPDALCCKYDPHFGRGLYAARDISEGETILVEDAFVFAKSPESRYQLCESCWKPGGNFIPCPQCVDTVFCDSQCMEAAQWYHTYDCGKNKDYIKPDSMLTVLISSIFNVDIDFMFNVVIQQVLRSVFYGVQCFGNVEQLWNFFLNIVLREDTAGCSLIPDNLADPRTKYGFFLTLGISKPKKINDYEQISFLKNISFVFYMNKAWLGKFSGEEQWKLQHMFLYNFHILCANSFHLLEGKGGVCYLMGSLFNHSCARNAQVLANDNGIVVTATKNVHKGEQIFIHYTDYCDWNLPRTHEYLKEKMGFDCSCEL